MEILDPNRNIDPRYVEYQAVTKSGRIFSGLLGGETATSITLLAQEGNQQVLLRNEIDELHSTGKSLMPEGLEKEITKEQMADLIAFLTSGEDMKSIAKQILDDALPRDKRQQLVQQHSDKAETLLAEMIADLKPGTPEEYRRIPWIWRVAVAAGKRNESGQLQRLLDVSLPRPGEKLHDWQAVVLGGGVINGISLQNVWPGPRVQELLKNVPGGETRWRRALDETFLMADNEKVPTGTRYDALRMIALDSWDRAGKQLTKYLAKGVHAELQMGAISGLADLDRVEVAPLLIDVISHCSPSNRKLAIQALFKTEERKTALREAVASQGIDASFLDANQRAVLRITK